jgi:hypothetical protein
MKDKDRQLSVLRIYFLLGLLLAFISLFTEWYLLQCIDNTQAIVVDWSYHLLFDWSSPSKLSTELNNWYRPENASMPLPLVLFFIGVLILASFGALFYGPERFTKIKNPKSFAFINVAVIILLIYFILIAPIVYLFPNQLLFPGLQLFDNELGLTFSFSVGLGYWCQLIAFTFCFPYTCVYYKISITFELTPNTNVDSQSTASFNIDKLIAEMELELHSSKSKQLASTPNIPDVGISDPERLEIEALLTAYRNRFPNEGTK